MIITAPKSPTRIVGWKILILPESREWIEAQNKITFDYLGDIPARDKIKARLTGALELRALRCAFQAGKALLSHAERRAAESNCALHDGQSDC